MTFQMQTFFPVLGLCTSFFNYSFFSIFLLFYKVWEFFLGGVIIPDYIRGFIEATIFQERQAVVDTVIPVYSS